MQAPLALQIGHSEGQSALLTQWTQTLANGSHRGCACGHCALPRQATHCPLSVLHTGAVDEVQSALLVQRTQNPRVSQMGVSAGHGAPFEHVPMQCPVDSQLLPARQSLVSWHCTQTLRVRSQRGRTGVQSKSLKHSTQAWDVGSQ